VLVLGERLSAPVTAGAVLLLGGLVIVSRRSAPRSEAGSAAGSTTELSSSR
jgi:DME family drug/metabolite transporter